jgi:hypothetical protein
MEQATHFRQPTELERRIIDRLLEPSFPGKAPVVRQLNNYRVRRIDDQQSFEFEIQTSPDESILALQRVPVEAEGTDEDGVPVYFLLHVTKGLVKELEIYKADGSDIKRMPEAPELSVVVLPPPTQ